MIHGYDTWQSFVTFLGWWTHNPFKGYWWPPTRGWKHHFESPGGSFFSVAPKKWFSLLASRSASNSSGTSTILVFPLDGFFPIEHVEGYMAYGKWWSLYLFSNRDLGDICISMTTPDIFPIGNAKGFLTATFWDLPQDFSPQNDTSVSHHLP